MAAAPFSTASTAWLSDGPASTPVCIHGFPSSVHPYLSLIGAVLSGRTHCPLRLTAQPAPLQPKVRLLIGGEFVESHAGKYVDVTNPVSQANQPLAPLSWPPFHLRLIDFGVSDV
jgi:hypothetical protein